MKMIPLIKIIDLNPRLPKGLEDSTEISFIPMAAVSEGGKIVQQESRRFADVKKGFTYFQRDDVLLAKITPCFENGKSAQADTLDHEVGFGSTEFHVLRAIPEKSDPGFIYHLVRSNRLLFLGKKSMKGAAGHKRVPADFLQKFEIPAWSLNDQKCIALLLGKVESLIYQRKQHLQQLDDLLKSVFLEMFGDPKSNPKNFPVKKLSTFYINPRDGAKCGPFGSALKKDEFVSSGVPVWNMDNIDSAGGMVTPFRMWITPEKYESLSTYSVIDGDIVISRAGTVGKMCVAKMGGNPGIISTNLIRLRLNNQLRPLHVVCLMTYCKGKVGRLKVGPDGAFTHMNTGILDKLCFPYPPLDLQDKFSEIFKKVDGIKHLYQESLNNLESLYSALSQKAFTGELDLSKVPMPEEITVESERDSGLEATVIEHDASAGQERSSSEKDIRVMRFARFDNGSLSDNRLRKELFNQWFNEWLAQFNAGAEINLDHFWQSALSTVVDYMDEEENPFTVGLNDYDQIKEQIFEAIKQGRLEQTTNMIEVELDGEKVLEPGNQTLLKKVG